MNFCKIHQINEVTQVLVTMLMQQPGEVIPKEIISPYFIKCETIIGKAHCIMMQFFDTEDELLKEFDDYDMEQAKEHYAAMLNTVKDKILRDRNKLN